MKRALALGAVLPLLTTLSLPAWGVDACENLPPDIALFNGSMFYRNRASGKVLPFNTMADLPSSQQGRRTDFAYIVRTWVGDRGGAVVIKSAKRGVPVDDSKGRVELVRETEANFANCRHSPRFTATSIPARAYDQHHEFGYRRSRLLNKWRDTISAFHVEYQGELNCRSTDDITDNNGKYERRNNRSQFAFDPRIVDEGWDSRLYIAVTDLFGTAQAGSDGLSKQRTEIRTYQTVNQMACIPFSVAVSGPEHFLQINDLEGKAQLNPAVRSQEVRR